MNDLHAPVPPPLPAAPRDESPLPPARSRGSYRWLTAVLAVLLGLVAAWGVQERNARLRQAGEVESVTRRTLFIQAHTADLLRLLAQPDTRIVRLSGDGIDESHTATIVWSPIQGIGYVHTDLPGPLSLTAAANPASPGQTLVEFDGAAPPATFVLPPGDWKDASFAIRDRRPATSDASAPLFLTINAPNAFEGSHPRRSR